MTALHGKSHTPRASRPNPNHLDWLRVHWPLPLQRPSVSIVIPTRDRVDLLRTCVRGLLERTDYDNFEIVIADNDSREAANAAFFDELAGLPNVRVLPIGGEFNYSRINNEAIRQCTSDIIVLLNNDIDVINSDWLTEMVSHAVRPDVGAVGAKLLYADGTIQHAGVILGIGSFDDEGGIAGHFGVGAGQTQPGYFGQYILTREVSAVTAACLAVRREVYEAVGGLNEADLAVAFNDVDLCLRIRSRDCGTSGRRSRNSITTSRSPAATTSRARRPRVSGASANTWRPVGGHSFATTPSTTRTSTAAATISTWQTTTGLRSRGS